MPALTFRHSTDHSSQNCGVFQATCAGTLWVTRGVARTSFGVHPAGVQPGGGRR